MNDHIFIENMEIECRVGTTPEERAFPQVLYLSIHISLPLREAGKTDNLKKTVDYAEIIQKIKSEMTQDPINLVEAAAEKVARLILAYPHVHAVHVDAYKKIFSGIQKVGASIYREKTQS